MRVHVVSDFHDEFHQTRDALPVDQGELGEIDFIISGGDIYRGSEVEHEHRWRQKNCCPVIKISGNHEHYKIERTVQENILDLRASADRANTEYPDLPAIHFLENDSVILPTRDGEQVKIIGATLWTNFRLYESDGIDQQTAMKTAKLAMNDYRLCGGSRDAMGRGFALTPEETLQYHQESLDYIVSELRESFDGIRIVLTHHSPAPGCLNPKFQKTVEDKKVSPSFGTDLSWICEDDELAPDLWISGHGHNSFDFEIGRTRHIGNPIGYQKRGGGRENPNFDPYLVIDTEMLPRFQLGGRRP
jgi:Icc-related predicted phosphoesterase